MNIHEAAELMARITAIFPNGNWPNSTIAEWTRDLCGYDHTIAEAARQHLKKTFTSSNTRRYQAPVWADFVDAYNAAKPRPNHQHSFTHEQLPTIERVHELAAAARSMRRSKEQT
jgi:hypothetical protein